MVWLGIGKHHACDGVASMNYKRRKYVRKKKEIRRAINVLYKIVDGVKREYELSDDTRNFTAMKRDLVVIAMNCQELVDSIGDIFQSTELRQY